MARVETRPCSVPDCEEHAVADVVATGLGASVVPQRRSCSTHLDRVRSEVEEAEDHAEVAARLYLKACPQKSSYSADDAAEVWDDFRDWCLGVLSFPSQSTYAEWRASRFNLPPTAATLCRALGATWMSLSQPLWNQVREAVANG